jgi:hypothetical protein
VASRALAAIDVPGAPSPLARWQLGELFACAIMSMGTWRDYDFPPAQGAPDEDDTKPLGFLRDYYQTRSGIPLGAYYTGAR